MTEQVISHTRPHRKRGRVWTRLGALGVTAIALAVATWLAPYVYRPAPQPLTVKTAVAAAPLKLARAATNETVIEEARAPTRAAEPRRAQRRPRPGVSLDAHAEIVGEELDILTAAELDAISQAE
jgi:hypothetical protein